jgi:sugar phosphate isomerase/epimerase
MSIKIAAYPKCFEYDIGLHRTMSIIEWINLAQENLTVDGLEMYERFFSSFEKSYLTQIVNAAHEAGFEIPMFICSPDFTHPNSDDRKRAIEYQIKMIEVAAYIGGEGVVCRILSGQQRNEVSKDQGIEWVVGAIEEVLPVACEYNVVLGMENHYKDSQWENPEFALKKDVFLEIINAINERECFGVQFDPSNAIVAGDDPIELLKLVKDRVVSMHASDRYFQGEAIPEKINIHNGIGYASNLYHGVIGKGLNDYNEIFRILSKEKFDGWVSIEDGLNGMQEMKESEIFLRKMIEKYF